VTDASRVKVTSLGSGSQGNATLVSHGETLLLIDCGYSCRELESRMLARGVKPDSVTAVLVTHEHGDHFNGVPAFSNKFKVPVYMSAGTSLHKKTDRLERRLLINSHQDFSIGELTVSPIAVPHDSREACQFVIKTTERKIGILTDVGHITPYIRKQYEDCDLLLLEFNHDLQLLLGGRYPASLKNRVSGPLGHLSNAQAADFLQEPITRKLTYLVAMHLSEENNQPSLVEASVHASSLDPKVEFIIAQQQQGFGWLCI